MCLLRTSEVSLMTEVTSFQRHLQVTARESSQLRVPVPCHTLWQDEAFRASGPPFRDTGRTQQAAG